MAYLHAELLVNLPNPSAVELMMLGGAMMTTYTLYVEGFSSLAGLPSSSYIQDMVKSYTQAYALRSASANQLASP